MAAPTNTSASGLYASDPQLKNLAVDKYGKPASDEAVEKTKNALIAKQHHAFVVNSKQEALDKIKELIPKGASVHNASSTSLIEIGFVDYFKTQTEWNNIHAKILAEIDGAKQAELRRTLGNTADYFLSSVTAVSETGEFTVVDLTGTRVGPFTHSAGKVIIVVGSNKIVPTYDDAVKRTEEYALPLESARARIAYGVPGSAINNFVAIKGANPWGGQGRFTVIIVKEALGY
mmetsp:Transcript_14343/g.20008  ORF Transcript_14343/g.20008 Transcript_14343/m.20008 type:complete len:232 (-) Transcript_14343:36-731(-)|eukprot:CAMPEP_0168556612 /NCGR_PEP_ID=MMETSP0413-20121227/8977_1 /TAXON_ID=136452 /ORGANISM="Filamoeba nolandi, Strain NC-AS-23-1" /LENGTH=231 /DNA_ID=CAMNT_0008587573 /DNA_START=66 /DNA_END=761 /DNA_ORIENTATION=+